MRVLIVEDDAGIATGLAATLRHDGHAVETRSTLEHAWDLLRMASFDAVLLDLGLPDGDGTELLRRLRASRRPVAGESTDPTTPVLIMTARDAVPDRVSGLDEGADDYLVKPFDPQELLARLRVALRRSAGRSSPLLRHADLVVDPAARTVRRAGVEVTLSTKEFALLMTLLQSIGQVLTRSRLEGALYGDGERVESNAIEVHVHHLRRKLGTDLIRTIRGVGYFVPRADA